MDTSIRIQKQIKDSNEDLQNYMRDLKLWEAEMKRKDSSLAGSTVENDVLPPVRRKKKKAESVPKQEEAKNSKRISGNDYSSWEKFDVEKACEDVDKESSEESVEENYADDAIVKREQALYEKAIGNRYVQDGKWDEAIGAYSRAITVDPNDAIFYANRALCYLKKNKWKEAEIDCSLSIQLDSCYVKAYQRRVEARKQLGLLKEAKNDLVTIIRLEPKNRLAQIDLEKIEAQLKPVTIPTPVVPKTKSALTPILKEEKKITVVEKCEPIAEHELPWTVGGSVVEAVNKPPHLRSKKPLKRILIKEVSSFQSVKTSATSVPPSIQQPVIGSPVPHVLSNRDDSAECFKELPLPKTSVQFEMCWKKIKHNQHQSYKFLKQFNGQDFPMIFKESLESNTFSEIVSVLASEFVAAGDPVLAYLEGLSKVRRFGALTLFMSSNDKSNVIKLFNHSRTLQENSEENISKLKKLYEI